MSEDSVYGKNRRVDLLGRLRAGVTREQAASELTALTRTLEAQAPPDSPKGLLPVIRSFEELVTGDGQMIVLQTTDPVDLATSLARDSVRGIDADVQVLRVAPFAEMLDAPLARPRFNAFVLGLFGVAALMLAGIGLYGVMAASVKQRDREIAIRMALGAAAGAGCSAVHRTRRNAELIRRKALTLPQPRRQNSSHLQQRVP